FNCPEIGNNAGIGTDRLKILADARSFLGSFRQWNNLHRPKGGVRKNSALQQFSHADPSSNTKAGVASDMWLRRYYQAFQMGHAPTGCRLRYASSASPFHSLDCSNSLK